jgi:hypothetical protein
MGHHSVECAGEVMDAVRISGFTFAHNVVKLGYPIVEAVLSVLPYVDEFILVDCDSNDGTDVLFKKIGTLSDKCHIHHIPWTHNSSCGGAIADAQIKAAHLCSGTHCWLVQADEIWWPESCDVIKDIIRRHQDVDRFVFPFRHLIGFDKQAIGAYKTAVRIIKNSDIIRVAGDGFTFSGGRELLVDLPTPIHHYGWMFTTDAAMKRKHHASLYFGSEQHRLAAEKVVAGADAIIDMFETQPYDGRHPHIIASLVKMPKYFIRPDLLIKSTKPSCSASTSRI